MPLTSPPVPPPPSEMPPGRAVVAPLEEEEEEEEPPAAPSDSFILSCIRNCQYVLAFMGRGGGRRKRKERRYVEMTLSPFAQLAHSQDAYQESPQHYAAAAMSSPTPAGTASAQPSNNSGVANPASSESNYNMNATPVEPARTADDNWAQVQDEA